MNADQKGLQKEATSESLASLSYSILIRVHQRESAAKFFYLTK
jgi:hypothetical protein